MIIIATADKWEYNIYKERGRNRWGGRYQEQTDSENYEKALQNVYKEITEKQIKFRKRRVRNTHEGGGKKGNKNMYRSESLKTNCWQQNANATCKSSSPSFLIQFHAPMLNHLHGVQLII